MIFAMSATSASSPIRVADQTGRGTSFHHDTSVGGRSVGRYSDLKRRNLEQRRRKVEDETSVLVAVKHQAGGDDSCFTVRSVSK